MLSNSFWYGFLIGCGLIFAVFFAAIKIVRAKKSK
jgi:prolipoprotein diacylglyceryltransferase